MFFQLGCRAYVVYIALNDEYCHHTLPFQHRRRAHDARHPNLAASAPRAGAPGPPAVRLHPHSLLSLAPLIHRERNGLGCPSQVSGLSPNQFTYPRRVLSNRGVRGWVASLEYVCQVCRQNLRIPAAAFTNWGSGDGSRDATNSSQVSGLSPNQLAIYVSPLSTSRLGSRGQPAQR